MALDSNADRLDITRSLLTRCLSHQVMAWYESLGRVKDLVSMFSIARNATYDYGYPDLYEEQPTRYSFVNTSSQQVSLRTIRWVKNGLSSVSRPLGVPVGALFVIGLCFSLTKVVEGGGDTSSKFLSKEVEGFYQYVEEQSIRAMGLHDIVRRRAKADGKTLDNTITQ